MVKLLIGLATAAFGAARVGVFGRERMELHDVIGCNGSRVQHVDFQRSNHFLDKVQYTLVETNGTTKRRVIEKFNITPIDVSIYDDKDELKLVSKGWDYTEWLSQFPGPKL